MEKDELMGDTFAMKVGNIPPSETAVIKLRYVCRLQARKVTDDAANRAVAVFRLPSVLNPRYTPPSSETERQFGPSSAIPVCKVNVPYKFFFSAGLKSQCAIMAVNSAKDVFKLTYHGEDKTAAKVIIMPSKSHNISGLPNIVNVL
ncbi:unnamed protein product [Dibothriocephalus latus]|uniref:VIT domain-containing protein n=1 Tax=Dibothriocephalus latus TaxID=60516 RepID=A0A3P7NVH3_DIBLA|nr:unnamed protein product [Dibothriocephalus latus]